MKKNATYKELENKIEKLESIIKGFQKDPTTLQKLNINHLDSSEIEFLSKKFHTQDKISMKSLFDSGMGTWSWDIISGEVYWDDQMQRIFGIEPGAFEGTFDAWKRCVHPDDIQSAEKATLAALEHDRGYDFEYRVKDVTGGWKMINARAATLWDNNGNPIRMSGFAREIKTSRNNQVNNDDTASKLKERVKELNCLYTISKLAEDRSLTTESLIQSVVDLMAPSFQYPDVTCASAKINKKLYKSKYFKKTKWVLSSTIYVDLKKIGFIEVYYIENKPIQDEGPFLKEERFLIDSVCESVGKILEHKKLTQSYNEVESRYKILINQFSDGIVILQDDQYKFVNKSFAGMIGYSNPKNLLGKRHSHYISSNFSNLYKKSTNHMSDTKGVQDKIEYQLVTRNKIALWVDENRNLINWEDSPATLCIIRDISQTKQQEILIKEETSQLREENTRLRSSLKERYRFHNIIGKSKPMQQVYDLILSAANSDANVSIYGESGTGKEMVANAIHTLSERKKKTLVPVNCGAIPETLLESEFFGYKKGAFTGATIDKHGYLDLANKGSLFLDEIGELQLNMQAKLLRAIDGGGYHPIGSNEKRQSDFRIITATNKDLKKEVTRGSMREDFYYRIHVIPIMIPPLRERKDDIPYLVEHFSKMYSENTEYRELPDKFLQRIYSYDWPGNVRELQNTLLRFFSTGQFELLDRIYSMSGARKTDHFIADRTPAGDSLHQQIEDYERSIILNTLEDHNWHRNKASEELGVTRNTLFRKMKKYGLISIHR